MVTSQDIGKLSQYPRVTIHWVDAERSGDEWEKPEDCVEWAPKELKAGETQGRLIHKCKDHVVVYATTHPEQWLHGLKIPRKWIQEIEYLD